jgi:hypothetical protein
MKDRSLKELLSKWEDKLKRERENGMWYTARHYEEIVIDLRQALGLPALSPTANELQEQRERNGEEN